MAAAGVVRRDGILAVFLEWNLSWCADQQEVGLRDTGVADDFQVSVLSNWKVGAARGCSGEDWGKAEDAGLGCPWELGFGQLGL